MIKINLKQKSSAPLNEVTSRYLRERFKLPQEVAEYISTTFRENGDALAEVFINQESQFHADLLNYPDEAIKSRFDRWLGLGGNIFNNVLKRFPVKKKELVDLAKANYNAFLETIQVFNVKANFPKDLNRKIKQDYRENHEELIMIFSAMNRYREPPIDYELGWRSFKTAGYVNLEMIDTVLKKHPSRKNQLVDLAIRDYHNFQDQIRDLYNSAEGKEEVILKLPHNYVWVNLHTTYCTREAKRMGHCGMAGNLGTLFSLRQVFDDGTDEPAVTIEMDETSKDVFQIKGGENRFPEETLWPFIYEFFKHFDIKEENIKERLAVHDEQFMSYFDESLSKSLEEQIDYLRKLATKSKEDLGTWSKFVTKFGKFMNRNIDLTIEQYVELFDIYFFIYSDGHDASNAIKTFFESYEPKLNMDFNIELVTKITDLLEERGRLTTRTISDLMYILVGKFNILISFKDLYKDQEKVKSAFQDLPILKRLVALYNATEKEEKEEEEKLKMREHRRNLPKVKFKIDHRGYFKL